MLLNQPAHRLGLYPWNYYTYNYNESFETYNNIQIPRSIIHNTYIHFCAQDAISSTYKFQI